MHKLGDLSGIVDEELEGFIGGARAEFGEVSGFWVVDAEGAHLLSASTVQIPVHSSTSVSYLRLRNYIVDASVTRDCLTTHAECASFQIMRAVW